MCENNNKSLAKDIDFYTKADISSSILRVEELLSCDIFQPRNATHTLLRSALTELLILVRDLIAKSKKYGQPIEFVDDIAITETVKNVSDAIIFVRDAICHVDSYKRNHPACNARLSFNFIYGKGTFAKIGDVEIKSDYSDDVCFIFGDQKLYLKRHLTRAFEEAKRNLQPLTMF